MSGIQVAAPHLHESEWTILSQSDVKSQNLTPGQLNIVPVLIVALFDLVRTVWSSTEHNVNTLCVLKLAAWYCQQQQYALHIVR